MVTLSRPSTDAMSADAFRIVCFVRIASAAEVRPLM
jgi:hypothetical protein